MSVVFGEGLWPIGWSIGLVHSPLRRVREVWSGWTVDGRRKEVDLGQEPLLQQLERLLPFEMPPRRRLFVELGDGWTAIFDNSRGGGDPFPVVSRLSAELNVTAVLATHSDPEQTSVPATQLHLFGPSGEPPQMYVRTIDAGKFDSGRWSFRAWGSPQPFEQLDRYEERLVRERFTRTMLLDYLSALGVRPDDATEYGAGVLYVERARWWRRPGWTGTLEQVRAEKHPDRA